MGDMVKGSLQTPNHVNWTMHFVILTRIIIIIYHSLYMVLYVNLCNHVILLHVCLWSIFILCRCLVSMHDVLTHSFSHFIIVDILTHIYFSAVNLVQMTPDPWPLTPDLCKSLGKKFAVSTGTKSSMLDVQRGKCHGHLL